MKRVIFVLIFFALSANAVDRYVVYLDNGAKYIKALEDTEKNTGTYKLMWFETKGDITKVDGHDIDKNMFMLKVFKDCTTIEIINYSGNKPVRDDKFECQNTVPGSLPWIMEQYMGMEKKERVKKFPPVKFYSGEKECITKCRDKYYNKEKNNLEEVEKCFNTCQDI